MTNHTIDELSTVADFIRWGASRFNEAQLFFGHGTENAVDEATALVLHALYLPTDTPDILWHTCLTYTEKQAVFELLQKRIETALPVPYLTNEAWFANLSFYVDSRVLIPRSPIAELIEQQFAPWLEISHVQRVLDLCTGCGCIAIATALALPDVEVDAVDVSLEALEIAQQNIDAYGLQERVHTIHSDLFAKLTGVHYDLIISNPPYVDAQELATMPAEYQYEPKIALEAGQDGLFYVKQILRDAVNYLTPHGVLIVEVGFSQAALLAQYPNVPFVWLEFKRGGEGVFLLSAEQLHEYAKIFAQAAHRVLDTLNGQ